jgi:hypothetical protein
MCLNDALGFFRFQAVLLREIRDLVLLAPGYQFAILSSFFLLSDISVSLSVIGTCQRMTESEVPTTRLVQWVASVKQRPTVTYDLKAGKTHATRNSHASPCASDARTTRSSLQPTGQPSHHLGDWDLFIDANNHESFCTEHHDGLIRREEARGSARLQDRLGRQRAPSGPRPPVEPRVGGGSRTHPLEPDYLRPSAPRRFSTCERCRRAIRPH